MAALAIPVHDLDSSGKDFVFALDEAWLSEVLRDTGVRGDASAAEAGAQDVLDERERNVVQVHAQRNGREVLVHGRAHACLVAECVRCLKGVPIEVSCELAALYTPTDVGSPRAGVSSAPAHGATHAVATDEELEVDPDEPDRETYSGDHVVIDDLVRDYLLLELPMQPRCELGWDCPNLDLPAHMRSSSGVQSDPEGAAHFGQGAIDPRLMPLQKLARREPDVEARPNERERKDQARGNAREPKDKE